MELGGFSHAAEKKPPGEFFYCKVCALVMVCLVMVMVCTVMMMVCLVIEGEEGSCDGGVVGL